MAVVAAILLATLGFIPLGEYMVLAKSEELRPYQDKLIPTALLAEDLISEDFLFPAWNIFEQKPYLFSRCLKNKEENRYTAYHTTVGDMIYAS